MNVVHSNDTNELLTGRMSNGDRARANDNATIFFSFAQFIVYVIEAMAMPVYTLTPQQVCTTAIKTAGGRSLY